VYMSVFVSIYGYMFVCVRVFVYVYNEFIYII
jgi:hypothetical protein